MTVAEVKNTLKFEEYAELYEYVEDVIDSIDEELFEEIIDSGIETVTQFEDAFAGCYEGYAYGNTSPEAQFCEELVEDCGYISVELPSFIANHIDYQAVWDCELRHDYFTCGKIYFFSNQF